VDAAGNLYGTSPNHTVSKGVPIFDDNPDSRLANISVRATLLGTQPLVASFEIRGSGQSVLLRGIGPGLQPFIPGGTLAGDPRLVFFDSSGATLASNDNWGGASALIDTFAVAGAFPLSGGSTDAALLRTFTGRNTVHFTSTTNGIGLLEMFDLGSTTAPGIRYLGARHIISTDANPVIIVGFTIEGPAIKTVLIRGIGPGLGASPSNTTDALVDPRLVVFNRSGQEFAANDDWPSILASVFERVGAFPIVAGSKDTALMLTLQPGSYSAELRGGNGSLGEAMIELYEVAAAR
jgi:hypothetical protein